MVLYQERSKHLASGAKLHPAHKKKKSRFGRDPMETKIGEPRTKTIRTRGGNIKLKAFTSNVVNVTNPKTQKTEAVPIKNLVSNQASVDYERRSIITKGAVVATKMGKVRITSRPGQVGALNGVLLSEK